MSPITGLTVQRAPYPYQQRQPKIANQLCNHSPSTDVFDTSPLKFAKHNRIDDVIGDITSELIEKTRDGKLSWVRLDLKALPDPSLIELARQLQFFQTTCDIHGQETLFIIGLHTGKPDKQPRVFIIDPQNSKIEEKFELPANEATNALIDLIEISGMS